MSDFICNNTLNTACSQSPNNCDGIFGYGGINILCMENNQENRHCINKITEHDLLRGLKDRPKNGILKPTRLANAVYNVAKKDMEEAKANVKGENAIKMIELMDKYNI